MQRNTSVSLGDHFVQFIDTQVQSGRFGSASDVVRAGLRLLEERELAAQALREALLTGERSGVPEPLDFDRLKAAERAALARTGG
jgi:antitoxin ParD1/3/4